MRVLVTGADGFVGRHLCAHLRQQGDQVMEAHGPREGPGKGLGIDVADAQAVQRAVAETQPEGIIHLAGFSSVGESHKNPPRAFLVNGQGTVHVLEAVRKERPRCRVVVVSSGEVYGPLEPDVRADETFPYRPISPYAGGKAAGEMAALQYSTGYKLEVVVARPFNHLGTGQRSSFVVPSFARQILAIRAGRSEPVLRTGDLTAIRDFSHVEDVVEAYRLLLFRGDVATAYNICSGDAFSVRQLLDELLSLAEVKARVEVDPSKLRPAELPSLLGNPARLESLGWKRRKTVRQALAEVLSEASEN